MGNIALGQLTIALLAAMVDAGAGHQDIMDNGKGAFAAYPIPMNIADPRVVQRCSFVHENAASVNVAGKWNFLGMEVVETRATFDIAGLIAQYVVNRVRSKENVRIRTQVYERLGLPDLPRNVCGNLLWMVMKVESISMALGGIDSGSNDVSSIGCAPRS